MYSPCFVGKERDQRCIPLLDFVRSHGQTAPHTLTWHNWTPGLFRKGVHMPEQF